MENPMIIPMEIIIPISEAESSDFSRDRTIQIILRTMALKIQTKTENQKIKGLQEEKEEMEVERITVQMEMT